LAAVVVTWFTFLPSFIFILAGGPFVESSRGKLQLTAPLTAITAAVVGVIASLAVFFLAHLAYLPAQGGNPVSLDWAALFIAVLAGFALMRLKWGVVVVIACCAVLGVAFRALF
jgi:chromate transporter